MTAHCTAGLHTDTLVCPLPCWAGCARAPVSARSGCGSLAGAPLSPGAVPTEPLTLTSPSPTPGRTVGAGPAAHSPDLSALTPPGCGSWGARACVGFPALERSLAHRQEEWVTARRLEEMEVGHVPGEGEARTGGTAAPGCAIARPGQGGSMPGWRGCFREREA